MKKTIHVRLYQDSEVPCIADIYFNTIYHINIRDYSQEQVNAWAPPHRPDYEEWKEKCVRTQPLVALIENKVVGFAEFERSGHIDCFFVHHEFQSQGVGSALMAAIEKCAVERGITRLYAEVSITARPFFERKGFCIVKQQTVVMRGIELINFVMEKNLSVDSATVTL